MDNKRTALFDFHSAHGGRMVPFAGWDMPVHYRDGIKAEHLATRHGAGLFDVSHMAQLELTGTDAAACFEALTPTDLSAVADGRVRYSLFLNEDGGVLDDLMVARFEGAFHLVVNAGRADHDIAHIRRHLIGDAQLQHHDDRALLALQGPEAATVLATLGLDLTGFKFMDIRRTHLAGIDLVITRSGYTGEDGFEISLAADHAPDFAARLVASGKVKLAGLGARDTLRMEAGLPLWGHELDETITPVMAGLTFALSKKRRLAADFPGAEPILKELANGPTQFLVGLLPVGPRPVRDGTVLTHNGASVGRVTSGGFAPSLDKPAALGLVDAAFAAHGTMLDAVTRGTETAVMVSALPLVPHRYVRC
ncbi:MAG: glycine cleavage system aminomethyltransferase GcvT [Candidatus Puniceispirillum sp.]